MVPILNQPIIFFSTVEHLINDIRIISIKKCLLNTNYVILVQHRLSLNTLSLNAIIGYISFTEGMEQLFRKVFHYAII